MLQQSDERKTANVVGCHGIGNAPAITFTVATGYSPT
jgi:hypothetical protein